jgi:hypothetical protein
MTTPPLNDRALTPWFSGDVKPAHKGVYQRLYDPHTETEEVVFCRWDGRSWYCCFGTADLAATESLKSPVKCNPWRGLAHPPKGAK